MIWLNINDKHNLYMLNDFMFYFLNNIGMHLLFKWTALTWEYYPRWQPDLNIRLWNDFNLGINILKEV